MSCLIFADCTCLHSSHVGGLTARSKGYIFAGYLFMGSLTLFLLVTWQGVSDFMACSNGYLLVRLTCTLYVGGGMNRILFM
ncbi:hypothetical protein EDC04DRAFT_2723291 [Pisolithus marmoratus]|nr:hypothetical protein EDC04DRAFT_2723291 [Pisolithus marmoratus]